jgi:hypothetical protein
LLYAICYMLFAIICLFTIRCGGYEYKDGSMMIDSRYDCKYPGRKHASTFVVENGEMGRKWGH